MSPKFLKSSVAATALVLAGILTPTTGQAVTTLTYQLRVNAALSTGVQSSGVSSAEVTAGALLILDLYAIINGTNGTHADDGFLTGSGAFSATGTVQGDWRGMATNPPVTNNVALAPFNTGISQDGLLFSTGAMGTHNDLVGSLSATGAATVPSQYFIATANLTPVFGVGATAGTTEFLIARQTYTVANSGLAGTTTLGFFPRKATNTQKFTIDGVAQTGANANGGSLNIVSSWTDPTQSVVITAAVPEPSAFGMLALGALGLVGFRRMGLRRTA